MPEQFTARLWRMRRGRATPSPAIVRCSREEAGVCLERWAFAYATVPDVPAAVRLQRLLATVAAMVAAIRRADWCPPPSTQPVSLRRQILATVHEHIRVTAGNGASLEHLARIAGYSRGHLHRQFRERYGQTIGEYVNACRWQRTQELLARGLAKKTIAFELGFSCPAAFSRWLRTQGEEK